jgi:hypothetical protein
LKSLNDERPGPEAAQARPVGQFNGGFVILSRTSLYRWMVAASSVSVQPGDGDDTPPQDKGDSLDTRALRLLNAAGRPSFVSALKRRADPLPNANRPPSAQRAASAEVFCAQKILLATAL